MYHCLSTGADIGTPPANHGCSHNTTNAFDELSNLSIECTGISENAYTSTPLKNTNSKNKSIHLNLTSIFKNSSF